MTSKNPIENNEKPGTTPPADVARKNEPSAIKRELTDEETAAVAGGGMVGGPGSGGGRPTGPQY